MSGQMTQQDRVAILKTPLGTDVLVVTRFDGSEALSELFEFRIDALSSRAGLTFDPIIGEDCTLRVDDQFGAPRQFTGVMTEARWVGEHQDSQSYSLVLRPWLWLLTRTSDCRIFHEKDALEIIKEVFSDRGMQDYRVAATEALPKLEYCVQYRETDFAFVSRLMEQHGLYYYFDHVGEKSIMVICDGKSSHRPVPDMATIDFIPQADQRRQTPHVYSWATERRFRTGRYELMDYNYLKPTADMRSPARGSPGNARPQMEHYDYPGKYAVKGDGEKYAKIKLQADIARDRRRFGEGDCVGLYPGGLVALTRHPLSEENKEYLVVRCAHSYTTQTYRSGGSGDGGYFGSYEFIDAEIQFRVPEATPKPLVYGPQTALVVGKSGEEIDVDEHGRILVRFYWDRKKDKSCRVRVAQTWAANKWGAQVIPRIDQEVVVEFLEGDPDRPIVTGCVYNGDNKVPYALPENKTMTGIKSDSSKGHNGYNEFVFDDKKGSEKIRMHGEKDHEVKIRNSETVEIGEIFKVPMGQASREHTLVKGDDKLTVKTGNQDVKIGMNQNVDVGVNRDVKVGLNDSLDVKLMKSETVGLQNNSSCKLMTNINADVMLTLQSSVMIKLQCGASSIMLTPVGIVINAPLVADAAQLTVIQRLAAKGVCVPIP